METVVRPPKKRSAGKIVFWIFSPLLLLLLLALILFGALSLFGFPYDDQAALLEQAPMSAVERFAFHASEQTADVALDKSDILFILSEEFAISPAELQEKLGQEGIDLAAYGLTLEKYGIWMDDGVYVTLLFKWHNVVPVPLRIDLDVAVDDGELSLRATDAHITRFTSMSLEELGNKYGFDAQRLSYQIAINDLNPWLSKVRNMTVSNGNFVLTYGIGKELFGEALADSSNAHNADYFIDDVPELSALIQSFVQQNGTNGDGDNGDDFTALLSELEENPGKIEEVRLNCLALANSYQAEKAFEGEKRVYTARFLPNVTPEAVAARHDEIYSRVDERAALMRELVQKLNKLYQNGGILYSDTALLNAETGEPLSLSEVVDDFTPYECFLSEADSRLMLCSGEIQMMTFGFETPLKKLPHVKGAAYSGLERDRVYMILLLTRMKNGQPAFVYLSNDGRLTSLAVNPVTEEQYQAYMESESVPAYTFEDSL